MARLFLRILFVLPQIGDWQGLFFRITNYILGFWKSLESDDLFEALKAHLSDEEILEFTYITCMYEMHATMSRALMLEYDNVPERVEEIPAPEGAGDILLAVDQHEDD